MEKTVADIIEMAIKREEAAYDFYMDIHSKVQAASGRRSNSLPEKKSSTKPF
jgi:rubrerythrin